MNGPASIFVERDFFVRKQLKMPPVKRGIPVYCLCFHDCAVSQGNGVTVVVNCA